MAEEIENAKKQVIVGRTVDGKYIVLETDSTGHLQIKLVDSAGNVINPSTEDTLAILNAKIVTHSEHVKTMGFKEAVGHGTTDGDIDVEHAMGKKTGINEGAFTILEEAAFVQPGGDTQMYLQSASAQDAAGGSGAEEITIEYFSLAWGQKKTITVIPTGASQVTISVSDIYRIHKVYVNIGHPAAGLITITNQAESVLYGQISQYYTFMQRCIFYVAEDEVITCTGAIISSYSKEGIIARLFASEEDGDGNVVTRARVACEIAGGSASCPLSVPESVENPNNKRIAIGLAVAGVAAGQAATGAMKGYKHLCE